MHDHLRTTLERRGAWPLHLLAVVLTATVWIYQTRTRSCDHAGCPEIARNELWRVATLVKQFQAQHLGRCPRDADEIVATGRIARTPLDPWGRPFELHCEGDQLLVCSLGPDPDDLADDLCDEYIW